MRMVVLDGYTLNPGDNPWTELEKLGDLTVYERTAPEDIIERSKGAQILFTNKTPLTAQTVAALPDLKLVAALATGYNMIDVAACAARSIPVCNVPDYSTPAVAQHVFALLLELTNGAGCHSAAIHNGKWDGPDFCFWLKPVMELSGKTLGLVGLGNTGRRVAELGLAFGMNVLAYNHRPKAGIDHPNFAFADLEKVFSASDVVSLHCPQTAENTGFVNASLLGKMKPSALFINTARGGLVNETDLAAALNSGKIAGAGLDVLSVEPPLPTNPLLTAKNCVLTPHIAWASMEARRRLMAIVTANVEAFLAGKPRNVVNGVK